MTISISVWFFFSSRRRHTRCLSDWSSDVCSSDLGLLGVKGWTILPTAGDRPLRGWWKVSEQARCCQHGRSEERRVGKECRSRRPREHNQNKTRLAPPVEALNEATVSAYRMHDSSR